MKGFWYTDGDFNEIFMMTLLEKIDQVALDLKTFYSLQDLRTVWQVLSLRL